VVDVPVTPPGQRLAPMSGARRRLVDELRTKGISDPAVLAAIEQVPRHLFVPTGVRHRAYEDSALPIGNSQTISQPFVHAKSLQLLALKPTDRVLEIGTGSGYQTALLAHLAAAVYTVERIEALLEQAKPAVALTGATNVYFACRDGTGGWPEHAPYDAILVSAGSPSVPRPLVEQLADGGRLITPVGDREEQTLVLVTRKGARFVEQSFDPVRFVPLLGEHGWAE
jgi:protein-L-isoaspartate(D-aspartate) O-methyltransferase